MRIGLIGSGNMARALAVGWDRPVTCSALEIEQAEALAVLVGGTAAASNSEVAANSDLVILCHKPKQLEEVAAEIAGGRVKEALEQSGKEAGWWRWGRE